MKDLYIERTTITPQVILRQSDGKMRFEGRCIPEDPQLFFDTILQWLDEYFSMPAEETEFIIQLEYVNSGSVKQFLHMFRHLADFRKDKRKILISWYYEEDDEAILDLGEALQVSVDIPFRLISSNE